MQILLQYHTAVSHLEGEVSADSRSRRSRTKEMPAMVGAGGMQEQVGL